MPRLLASSYRSAQARGPLPGFGIALFVSASFVFSCFVVALLGATPAAAAAAASDQARLDRAVQGMAGTILSVDYARDFAPERRDLAKHAIAGGAISTVVGSLCDSERGWQAGVIIGAGKELVNDALLGRGCAQFDDFLVTASAAVFSGRLSSRVAPLVYVDRHGAEVRFSYAF